jgi:hypothetical protein
MKAYGTRSIAFVDECSFGFAEEDSSGIVPDIPCGHGQRDAATRDPTGVWHPQSRRSRIWGTVGLFGLVAIGVLVGIQLAIVARSTHQPAAGSTGPAGYDEHVGRSGASGPHDSGGTLNGAHPQVASPGGPVGNGGPAGSAPVTGLPGAPGPVMLTISDTGIDLNVSVTWTAAPDNGHTITDYLITLHSGVDTAHTVYTPSSLATNFAVVCSGTCQPSQVSASVHAVNPVGRGPETTGRPGTLPVANPPDCTDSGNGSIECTLSASGGTVAWTNSPAVSGGSTSATAEVFRCVDGQTYVITVTDSNAAGQEIRSTNVTCNSVFTPPTDPGPQPTDPGPQPTDPGPRPIPLPPQMPAQ